MSRSWLEQIEIFLLVVLSGFMLWPMGISSSALIGLLILTIIRRRKQALPRLNDWWIATPLLVVLFSWFFGGFADDGWREVKLWPILPVALVVFSGNHLVRHFRTGFLVFSVLQAIAVICFLAFQSPFGSTFFSYEVREAIGETFKVHPTYLSASWFFAAFLLMVQPSRWPWIRIAGMLVLVLAATLTGGKMALLAFVIISSLWIWNRWRKPRQKFISLTLLIAAAILMISLNPALRQRFDELLTIRTEFKEGDMLSSTDMRIGIWSCGIRLVSEHPFFGVGSGNTREALEGCFEEYGQVEFFQGEYNTHNQYLHFGLLAGMPGLTFFMAYMLAMLIIAIRRKQALWMYTLLFLSILFLTENYLGRQLGMMFFSFFLCLGFVTFDKQPGSAQPSDSR